jgi:DNA replication protein DnaC
MIDDVLRQILARTEGHILARTPEEIQSYDDHEAERRWMAIAQRIGVPGRYQRITLAQSEPRPIVERVMKYMRDGEFARGMCLILGGPARAGKTHAAVLALRNPITSSLGFFYLPDLMHRLTDFEQRIEAMHEVQHSVFVVLDDLGVEYRKQGGLTEAFIEQIIWGREANRLPTIITTNRTWPQLVASLSDRIIERFREWASYYSVLGRKGLNDGVE